MHQIILWIFTKLKDLEKTLRIIVTFLIMTIGLYWFMNLLGKDWAWFSFMKPVLDPILNTAENMYSGSFDFWGKVFEVKYFVAVTFLLIVAFCLKGINIVIEFLQDIYENLHLKFKKSQEKILNLELKNDTETKERHITKFLLYVQTKSSSKYTSELKNNILEEQTVIMNKFLSDKTGIVPEKMWDGYVYKFNNIDKIDRVLDLLFKIKNTEAPIHYLMCIQAGESIQQLRKLAELQHWGKITIAADTLYRYNIMKDHEYETSSVGIFQNGDNTLEVHEIVKKS